MIRPVVSCICVTKNRRLLVRQAIGYFERARWLYEQKGGRAELVIIDGSDKPHKPDRDVRYFHLPSSRAAVGLFHNVACEESKGDVVIQWDDDDWQSPYRIAKQVDALELAGGEALTFSSRFWWYHLSERRACRARSWDQGEGSAGALFAYHRSAWKAAPFRDVDAAEDHGFCIDQRARGTAFIDSLDPMLVVYMRHNVNGSALTNYRFTDDDTREARALLGADVDFYDELAEILPLTPWNHPNAPGSKAHVLSPLQTQWARHFR